MSLDIYAEELIRLYEHPMNKRKLDKASASADEETSPAETSSPHTLG